MGGTRTETRTSLGAELAGVCRRAAIGTYVNSGFEDTPPLAHSLTACSFVRVKTRLPCSAGFPSLALS